MKPIFYKTLGHLGKGASFLCGMLCGIIANKVFPFSVYKIISDYLSNLLVLLVVYLIGNAGFKGIIGKTKLDVQHISNGVIVNYVTSFSENERAIITNTIGLLKVRIVNGVGDTRV